MAITAVHYHIYNEAVKQGAVKTGGAILELGEANYYGDIPIETVKGDVKTLVDDPVLQKKLLESLEDDKHPNLSLILI